MATNVYQTKNIKLINGKELEIIPLKIKYLREFMEAFEDVKKSKSDDEAVECLVECVRISMKQFYPEISKNKSDIDRKSVV
jgi:hypothetical protein